VLQAAMSHCLPDADNITIYNTSVDCESIVVEGMAFTKAFSSSQPTNKSAIPTVLDGSGQCPAGSGWYPDGSRWFLV